MTIQYSGASFTPGYQMPTSKHPLSEALACKQRELADVSLLHMFDQDPQRFEDMSIVQGGLMLDYSKNRVDRDTMMLLVSLARSADLEARRDRMLAGEQVNTTEQRAALHVALRRPNAGGAEENATAVGRQVHLALDKTRAFANDIRSGRSTGYAKRRIRDVVNIGIGGSDLGPALVTSALRHYGDGPRVHFISSVDGEPLLRLLRELDAASTMFIVSSKTFTTRETLINAESARAWVEMKLGASAIKSQFAGVTANVGAAVEFGMVAERVFPIWDWVGGRYSVWSAIGLPVMLAIGAEKFDDFLAGGHEMDEHFRCAPLVRNMPVILGLLSVWYRNFWGCASQAILPYERRLELLPSHLQQLSMESNGKLCTHAGHATAVETAPVIWGASGNNGQHAFFQFLHQGTSMIPCDFIVGASSAGSDARHHQELLANCLAQSEALMCGLSYDNVVSELIASGMPAAEARGLAQHKVMPGDRPSNTLIYQRLTPRTMGALLALYEHSTFVQAAIWDINPFDQWGVELGKKLAANVVKMIDASSDDGTKGSSSMRGLRRQITQYNAAAAN